MSGNKAKYFWRGVIDGFCAPFDLAHIFGLGKPVATPPNTEAMPSPKDIDEYARRNYVLFIESVGAEHIVPSYDADILGGARRKARGFFFSAAIEGVRKFEKQP